MLNSEHRSFITVNRAALLANLEAVKKNAGQGVLQMAVIKDQAYGHGAGLVADALADEVDWFCVATAEEGIALRNHGIEHPVLIFEPPRTTFLDAYPAHHLTITITEPDQISKLKPGTEYHLNFDTGMRRLGISSSDTEKIKKEIRLNREAVCTGIYTHFANSDIPGHLRVTQQLKLFRKIRREFPEEWLTHLSNSGAIFNYRDEGVFWDASRPGVCLYGYAPGHVPFKEIQPVLEWKSYLIQVKPVKKGNPVGYGSTWQAPEDGFIGIVPAGYADGLSRNLSNGTHFFIDDTPYPVVGNITMDYSTVFLGQDRYETGQEVVLISVRHNTVRNWANQLDTITYEITTSLSSSIQRILI